MIQFIEVQEDDGTTTLVNAQFIAAIGPHPQLVGAARMCAMNGSEYVTVLSYSELRGRLCGQSTNPLSNILQ